MKQTCPKCGEKLDFPKTEPKEERINKCPSSFSGKHSFETAKWYIEGTDKKCTWCGFVDDRGWEESKTPFNPKPKIKNLNLSAKEFNMDEKMSVGMGLVMNFADIESKINELTDQLNLLSAKDKKEGK
jgi:hypothetical protein